MKRIIYPLLFLLITCCSVTIHAQQKRFCPLGNTIMPTTPANFFGEKVAISAKRVAVLRSGLAGQAEVQVREWDGTDWLPVGAFFTLSNTNQIFTSITLQGNRLAIGKANRGGWGTSNGSVQVYNWDGTNWTALGTELLGSHQEEFGRAIAMHGNRLAVAANHYNNGTARNVGRVLVYEWDGNQWNSLGNPIIGTGVDSYFGNAIDFDGQRVAVGAYYDRAGNQAHIGSVRVYEWTGTAWQQQGATLTGEQSYDYFGKDVALHQGRLAVGAIAYNSFGQPITNLGYTKVYEWTGSTWQQMGAKVEGRTLADGFGYTVDLEGDFLAVGAFSGIGFIFGYEWDGMAWDWKAYRTGQSGSFFGTDLAVEKGRIIVGASRSPNGCYAQVYEWCTFNSTTALEEQNRYQVYPNPTTNLYHIELEKPCQQVTLQLHHINGHLLENWTYQNWQKGTLSLQDYPSGVYVLTLQVEGQMTHSIKVQKI